MIGYKKKETRETSPLIPGFKSMCVLNYAGIRPSLARARTPRKNNCYIDYVLFHVRNPNKRVST